MEELGASYIVAKSTMEGGCADNDIMNILDTQHDNASKENGCLSDSANLSSSSGSGNPEKENIDHDSNTITVSAKTDGPEAFLMPAIEVPEREKETGDKRVIQVDNTYDGESHSVLEQQSSITTQDQEQSEVNCQGKNPLCAKGNRLSSKHRLMQPKLQNTSAFVPEKRGNASSQFQKSGHPHSVSISSKGISKSGVKDVMNTGSKQKRTTEEKLQVVSAGVLAHGSCSSVNHAGKIGGLQSNHTAPRLFVSTTRNKAASGSQHTADEAGGHVAKQRSTSGASSSLAAKSALRTSTTNISRTGNSKLNRQVLKDLQQKQPNGDVEDACSVDSSVSSLKAYKSKPANSSSLVFVSRCDERAEKRKEFFSKLDEKLHAKEVERNQLQAKTKEEKEAALKELRKSLTFKATPMPSFYREPGPPKVEIKKVPPTRAISPKLGRKKNSSALESEADSIESCRTPCVLDKSNVNKSEQKLSHSANAVRSSGKDRMAGEKAIHKSLTKLPSEKTMMTKSKGRLAIAGSDLLSVADTESANGSIESGKVNGRESHNSSASSDHDPPSEVQQSETILQQMESGPFSMQNETSGTDILKESDSLIDTEEFGQDLLASNEDLQACFDPKLM